MYGIKKYLTKKFNIILGSSFGLLLLTLLFGYVDFRASPFNKRTFNPISGFVGSLFTASWGYGFFGVIILIIIITFIFFSGYFLSNFIYEKIMKYMRQRR